MSNDTGVRMIKLKVQLQKVEHITVEVIVKPNADLADIAYEAETKAEEEYEPIGEDGWDVIRIEFVHDAEVVREG